MRMDSQIALLNAAAREVYNPTSAQRNIEANATFEQLSESPENLGLILEFLERGEQPNASYIASSSLKKLTERRITISIPEQLRLSSQLLQFLASHAADSDRYASRKLCEVFANICKFNFIFRDAEKNYPFRQPLNQVQKALTSINPEGVLALEILTSVIDTFDNQIICEGTTEHRQVHNEFQNRYLRDYFATAVAQIIEVVSLFQRTVASGGQPTSLQYEYLRQLLIFFKRIFEYEFLGSCYDMEERETVDLPSSWRQKILTIYEPVFVLYQLLPATQTDSIVNLLTIIGCLSSVRRTVFDSEERATIIGHLLNGIQIILIDLAKLNVPQIFVEFSRFLFRLIKNFTFTDLARQKQFTNELLPVLSNFTIGAFQAFDTTASNGIFYLLAFWQAISVHAVMPIKNEEIRNPLESIKPIPIAFVESRMRLCDMSLVGEADSPFDDNVSIVQFMDHFSGLCRTDLASMAVVLKELFEENAQTLMSNEPGSQSYLLAELKLVFWTYIVGACLDNRDSVRCSLLSNEDPEEFDITLFVKVSRLATYNTERLKQHGNFDIPQNIIELELAILSAYDRFRVSYLNETHRYYNEIQNEIVKQMGIVVNDDTDPVWELYLEKIATNIRVWANVDEVMTKSLTLFTSLTSSTSMARKILKLATVQYMFANHDEQTFPFLGSSGSKNILRTRTAFYSSLMRILCYGIDETQTMFDTFIKPVEYRMQQILSALNQGVNETGLKNAIAGVARDFRGMAEACRRSTHYACLMGWCHDKVYAIFLQAVERFYNEPQVTVPILKCLAEFALNRNARLAFSLVNFRGPAIFMEISKIVTTLCERFQTLPQLQPNDSDFYSHRLKVVGAMTSVLKNVLNGNYLPLGLFYTYNDRTFKNMTDTVFRLFTHYAQYIEDIPKIQAIYSDTIYELGRVYPVYITHMPKDDVTVFFHYLERGFHSSDRVRLLNSSTTFERVTDMLLESTNRRNQLEMVHCEPVGDAVAKCLESEPNLLRKYFETFMHMVVFDPRPIHYMAGRVLYNIVHLCPQMYPSWRDDFLSNLTPPLRDALMNIFSKFFTQPFDTQEREAFTVAIEAFHNDLKDNARNAEVHITMDQL
uniref:Importin N-terminal domain-containing protein n=1 Tax=Panagrellus redivivus TaxID=6233 RepID=A0A7E4VMZ8_PANRE